MLLVSKGPPRAPLDTIEHNAVSSFICRIRLSNSRRNSRVGPPTSTNSLTCTKLISKLQREWMMWHEPWPAHLVNAIKEDIVSHIDCIGSCLESIGWTRRTSSKNSVHSKVVSKRWLVFFQHLMKYSTLTSSFDPRLCPNGPIPLSRSILIGKQQS